MTQATRNDNRYGKNGYEIRTEILIIALQAVTENKKREVELALAKSSSWTKNTAASSSEITSEEVVEFAKVLYDFVCQNGK